MSDLDEIRDVLTAAQATFDRAHPPQPTKPEDPRIVAILGILARIDAVQLQEAATGSRRWHESITRAATGRLICDGCGCLCLPDERCPGCQVRAEQRRTRRHLRVA